MYIRLRHKINENVSQAKSILKKQKIAASDPTFLELRKDLKGKEGYLGWFTKMIFVNKVGLEDVKNVIGVINDHPEVIKSLPKQLIKYDKWEDVLDAVIRGKENILAKRIWNKFPSQQKKLLPFNTKRRDYITLLSSFYKNKEKENLLKKISRYKTSEDLIKAIQRFIKGDVGIGFKTIMNKVEGTNIIHSDDVNDIIIVEVNYEQCNSLGSDTSWCLIGSKGTFDNYTEGVKSQYIIFLTDRTGNYSKIGVTYGFRYDTAHLKDDTGISERELSDLLKSRGTDIKILEADRDEFTKTDKFLKMKISELKREGFSKEHIEEFKRRFYKSGKMKTMDIVKLQSIGFSNEEIINNRGLLKKKDLEHIPDKLIDDLNLKDKTELDRGDFEKNYTFEWIEEFSHRFNFKLNVNDIVKIHPIPRQLDSLDRDLFDKGAKDWLKKLDKHKDSIIRNAITFNSYYWTEQTEEYTWDKGNHISTKEHEKKSLDAVMYALKYSGFHDGNYTDQQATEVNIGGSAYDFKKWMEFLEISGFREIKNNFDQLSKIAPNFISGRWGKEGEVSDWFKILEDFPILKPKVREVIERGNQWGSPKYYESTLKDIKREFPDLYPGISKKQTLEETHKIFKETLPNPRHSNNWGLKRPIGHFQRDKDIGSDPQEYYDRYWDILKEYKWNFGEIDAIYMIFTLAKTGHFDEIPNMKGYWDTESYGRVIRAALDVWGDNTQYLEDDEFVETGKSWKPKEKNKNRKSTTVTNIHPDFKLNEEEKEKLFETLLQKIPVESSRQGTEGYEMVRHRTFSLLYYLYDWGFERYMNIVKNLKNNWDVYGITNKGKTMRLGEFGHIISHLANNKEWDEVRKIIDEVLSWEMDDNEKQRTVRYLKMAPSWLRFGNREEYEKEILGNYNIKPY
ncbi:MAG: hypothetical protein SLAVMIC_00576 [uncultured marine phage]|uniref:Uncharacterized protein n=1 Tax=uncultured marine phage TaxID=707152 RepID=A0A8D9C956_9VIRU|nr:MAG: hypothetical protein SLAVMIC_00576 [uncultured marine phage]